MNTPEPAPVPTKAQAELLAWMIAAEERRMTDFQGMRNDSWSGGSLIDFYAARHMAETLLDRERRNVVIQDWMLDVSLTAGSPRSHAWRRAGGTALKNLAARGFANLTHYNYGVPQYVLTELGRKAERQYRIYPGEKRWNPRAVTVYAMEVGAARGKMFWFQVDTYTLELRYPSYIRSLAVYAEPEDTAARRDCVLCGAGALGRCMLLDDEDECPHGCSPER